MTSSTDSSDSPQIIATTIEMTDRLSNFAANCLSFPEIDSVAKSLVVVDDAVSLPDGWSMRDVEVVSSGYPAGSMSASGGVKTEVRELEGGQTRSQLSMGNSRWSAVINQASDGWIAADAYEVFEGPSTDILLIPMTSPYINKEYSILARSGDDSATCTFSIQGPAIDFDLQSTLKSKAHGYKVRIAGSFENYSMSVDVFHRKDSGAFTFMSQPSKPVVIVTRREVLSPMLVWVCLIKANLVSSAALVGGFGKGTINAELSLEASFLRSETFVSERIAASNSI